MPIYKVKTTTSTQSIGHIHNTYTIPAKNAPHAIKHIQQVISKHKLPERITGISKPKPG